MAYRSAGSDPVLLPWLTECVCASCFWASHLRVRYPERKVFSSTLSHRKLYYRLIKIRSYKSSFTQKGVVGDSENSLLSASSCIPLLLLGSLFQEIKRTCHTTSYQEEMKKKEKVYHPKCCLMALHQLL